ncbi:primosomal protein N' [Candidatus Saccharibacteria bacterium]|nr:primosomal protein N' [Candidatus Saccharibacteria bacterium]
MFYEVIPVGKIDEPLTYSAEMELMPGQVVLVPLMRRMVPGVVVKKVAQPDFKCRAISKILYATPLPKQLIAVTRFIHEYYLAPIGNAAGVVLPNGVEKKRRRKTEQPDGANISPGEYLAGDGGKTEHLPAEGEIRLNQAQKNALQALQQAQEATKMLFGVTGSGKTNIYLKMALNALKRQKSTILLVPEIALTGQLVRVFREVFGDRIVLIHSQQTEAERHLIFEGLLEAKEPRIVVGPRSALFAPLRDLGLIIIDEAHENTYFQENVPKYSAVRVASYMAKVLGCDCILGSATPTVADYYIAEKKGSLIELAVKAKDTAVKPQVKIIDFKDRGSFVKNRYFSNALLAAITDNLAAGRQTLIFHNRRGSSPLTICESCGEEVLCPNCFLPLTLHADNYELVCHTCGFHMPVPVGCPKCGAAGLIHKGFGTKLLESEIQRLFPTARVMRFDADNKKGEGLDAAYSAVREGGVDILVGTQVLAKGLDLPRLATVGVVQADAGLSLPDFAAEERTFQLLTQVIGRVGRGHIDVAQVFVQTYQPEHPVLKFAVAEDYKGFSEYALKRRRASGFPPFWFVARCEITMKTEATVLRKMREACRMLARDTRLKVSPPMPAFHERTAKGYSWQIVIRARSRAALVAALAGLDKNFRVTLDPPSLL